MREHTTFTILEVHDTSSKSFVFFLWNQWNVAFVFIYTQWRIMLMLVMFLDYVQWEREMPLQTTSTTTTTTSIEAGVREWLRGVGLPGTSQRSPLPLAICIFIGIRLRAWCCCVDPLNISCFFLKEIIMVADFPLPFGTFWYVCACMHVCRYVYVCIAWTFVWFAYIMWGYTRE